MDEAAYVIRRYRIPYNSSVNNKGLIFLCVILLVVITIGIWQRRHGVYLTNIGDITLSSTAFTENQPIPKSFTCDGDAGHPPLSIDNVPSATKSLVITLDDPDAPGKTFHHWVVWNIPSSVKQIPAAVLPLGSVEGTNSAGRYGYIGPCPPSGTHRYIFTLTALNTTLDLPATAKSDDVEAAMKNHILARTNLTGSYSR